MIVGSKLTGCITHQLKKTQYCEYFKALVGLVVHKVLSLLNFDEFVCCLYAVFILLFFLSLSTVVTVNDYLAQRDAEWMGRVHRFLGLSVGLIQVIARESSQKKKERRKKEKIIA